MTWLSSRKETGSDRPPAAIWASFARQAAWKDCAIAALIVLNASTIVAGSRLAARDPDVVLVAPDGKSTYVARSVASTALLDFIAAQKQQPSDLTVVHFTKDFVRLALSANASTIDSTWKEALSMMGDELRGRLQAESHAKKLVESLQSLKLKTSVFIEDIALVERTKELLQVKATVIRTKGSLIDDTRPSMQERVVIELVERVVPRTLARPDGLEVVEWRFAPQGTEATEGPVKHAP